jgi:hypothetical protein
MIVLANSSLWKITDDRHAPARCDTAPDKPIHVAVGDQTTVVADSKGKLVVAEGDTNGGTVSETAIADPITSLLILRENPLALLVGTECPRLYRADRRNVEAVSTFDRLGCRSEWHTPWGGPAALRSLARGGGEWVYADIHVGSIMRSPDNGVSWEPVTPDLNEDVHQVATTPAHPTRVYANTAHAVYISDDCGTSWSYRGEGLGGRYGRAIAIHPDNPEHLLASVSDGAHGENVHGQLYISSDAGRSWSHVTAGFPESTSANIDTFHVAFTKDGSAWAAVAEQLYVSSDGGHSWRKAWTAPEPISMIAVP